MGQVSLRQVRVFSGSCNIPAKMTVLNVTCYAEYGIDTEDQLPFAAAAQAADAVAAAENSTSTLPLDADLGNATSPSDPTPSPASPDNEEPAAPPLNVLRAVQQGLVYADAESLGTRAHFGLYTWYYGGGYRVLLPNDENEAKMALEQLKAYKWLDSGTRAVFVTSYMYPFASAHLPHCVIVTLLSCTPTLSRHWHLSSTLSNSLAPAALLSAAKCNA